MAQNSPQEYRSTDTNMPPLCGVANSLPTLLRALLVDGPGFTGVSVTSITRSGTTATATVSAANALRLRTNMSITISGATGGDASLYNITAPITFTPGGTTFTYTMGGTPTGSATGTLFMAANQSITSITRSGPVATVTLAVTDTNMRTGMQFAMSGATGGDASLYNVTASITVLTTSTFTYTMAGTPSGSATGTLVCGRAPAGWSCPFSAGTNSLVFLMGDASVQQHYLQVIDNAATAGAGKESQIYGAETMSGDQAVTLGRFPTTAQAASGISLRKSTTADSVVREWVMYADNRTFYLVVNNGEATAANQWRCIGFGYFLSNKPGDTYNTFIGGDTLFNSSVTVNGMATYGPSSSALSAQAFYIARHGSQVGGSQIAGLAGYSNVTTIAQAMGAVAFVAYPNPSDAGVYVSQMLLLDNTGSIRGRMPGYFQPLHNLAFNNGDTLTGVTGLSGVTLRIVSMSASTSALGQAAIDVFGPWT